MDKEEFLALLKLAKLGALHEGGPEDQPLLDKFRAWLYDSEIITAEEAGAAVSEESAGVPRPTELAANIDAWTRRLWRTSQDGRMVIKCAGEVQQVVDEMREAAGLEELG